MRAALFVCACGRQVFSLEQVQIVVRESELIAVSKCSIDWSARDVSPIHSIASPEFGRVQPRSRQLCSALELNLPRNRLPPVRRSAIKRSRSAADCELSQTTPSSSHLKANRRIKSEDEDRCEDRCVCAYSVQTLRAHQMIKSSIQLIVLR